MKIDQQRTAKRIHEIRTNLGYSMAQFGELVSNSPKTTVNNWERGINLPKEDKLKKIALLGKTTVNELLYGTPEEVIANLLKDHFKLQVNPAFLQQIITFLKQKRVDVYDEMTIMEFLQGIMDSGLLVEQNDPYLVYSKVAGTEALYTAATNDSQDSGPLYYAYVDVKHNEVHLLPYTFAKKQRYLYHNLPNLEDQVEINYFTRSFPMLNIDIDQSTIIYYGLNIKLKDINIVPYIYDKKSNTFRCIERVGDIYNPFAEELKKASTFFE